MQRSSEYFFAEREGFEPPEPLSSTVFKTAAIDHSAIFPTTKVAPFFISAKSFFRQRSRLGKTDEKKALHLSFNKVAEPLNRPLVAEFRILGHLIYRADFILKAPQRFANPHEIYQCRQKRKHDSDYQACINHRAENSRQPDHERRNDKNRCNHRRRRHSDERDEKGAIIIHTHPD